MPKRTKYFHTRTPLVGLKGTDTLLKPDVFLIIQNGEVHTARLNEQSATSLPRLMFLMREMLEELQDIRHYQQIRQEKKRK